MGKLFAVIVAVITVISSAIFLSRAWWMPADISVLANNYMEKRLLAIRGVTDLGGHSIDDAVEVVG